MEIAFLTNFQAIFLENHTTKIRKIFTLFTLLKFNKNLTILF